MAVRCTRSELYRAIETREQHCRPFAARHANRNARLLLLSSVIDSRDRGALVHLADPMASRRCNTASASVRHRGHVPASRGPSDPYVAVACNEGSEAWDEFVSVEAAKPHGAASMTADRPLVCTRTGIRYSERSVSVFVDRWGKARRLGFGQNSHAANIRISCIPGEVGEGTVGIGQAMHVISPRPWPASSCGRRPGHRLLLVDPCGRPAACLSAATAISAIHGTRWPTNAGADTD